MLRVVRTGAFTPAPFTIFGWEVEDIHATIAELTAKGVEFLRFSFFQQDEAGVWTSPDGSQVAWFKDPDGNTLSLSRHTA
jgi:predicted enzyme related to lactoylglutathione lyase